MEFWFCWFCALFSISCAIYCNHKYIQTQKTRKAIAEYIEQLEKYKK